ncbi:2-polyprenylphenol 6-hydroxylase [Alkalicaulis satelles]|uniref:2-polyprenylphenol 6-hydroxylase n=1 Tax=Alkalicaulis satelles TaxID=2609175 RepID=A0A5M6Z8F5_9PROT|nr:2-polyprenylphenol 6-hydroxylase [Alkalicaulis satelles]KAA5800893.1 2-polyprenylphenol 6-hydroxylase [Alkalicaulis satelles]
MFATLSHLARLARAAWTLARHDAIFPAEYQAVFPAPARWLGRFARLIAIRDRAANPGERLARALEALGPAYVKFGQVLATRADVVGAEFARGLARLQDRMAPFGEDEARAILESELGAPVSQLFAALGPSVAAASIAQVHKARTPDGRDVAVKILRPGIERRIARDIAALRLGARLAEGLFPQSRRMEPRAFVETVARSLVLELDLRLEAASASELSEAALAAENLHIPEVDWARTAKRVMTLQWVDAIALTDMDALDAAGIDRIKLARDLTDAFLSTALERGVFHADMHAGNLFVGRDGRLWAVDFGIMGRLGMEERRYLALILNGFLTRDYDGAAEAHFQAGYVPERHTRADFASALRAVAEPIFGKSASEVAMSRVLLQLFEITDLFDMRLQPQLVLLQKTMVQAEGVCRLLSQDHNMWEASGPAVTRFMRRELGPEGKARDILRDLDALRATVIALPATLERLTEAAERLKAEPPETGARRAWGRMLLLAAAALTGGAAGAALYAAIAL